MTAPGRPVPAGGLHPILLVERQMREILHSFGLEVLEGPGSRRTNTTSTSSPWAVQLHGLRHPRVTTRNGRLGRKPTAPG